MRNPNGYGSIVKMSGKRRRPYGVRVTVGFDDDGKQRYKYIGYYATRPDALIALAEYNKMPYDIDANNITFGELCERYHASGEFSAAMIKLHKTCYRHTTVLHRHIFRDLRKAHLQGVINDLETITAKHNVASYFRKLYRYALENDIVLKNYADFVETPPQNRKTDKVPFNADEINTLWDNVGNINAEILLILLYSGMRISELLTLRKDQVYIDENYIITGSKTDAGKDRYIPIHPRIKPLLTARMVNDTEYVIVNSRGDKPIRYDSFHAKRFTKLIKRLKFRPELTPHSTRHYFISELHRRGADKIAVQKIVGHKGDDVTEHTYTHINADTLHAVVGMLE